MFQVSTSLFLVWLSSLAFVACEDPSTPSINLDIGVDEEMISSSDGAIDIDVSTPEEIESTCQSNRRPLVLIHGFLGAGDTWNRQISRLIETGTCRRYVKAFDWNSLDMSGEQSPLLDAIIDELIAQSDYDQVDLVGHSAGGGVAYTYLENINYAAKVHRYVHIASFPNDMPAGSQGEVPTLNLWSTDDLVVEGAEIPNAENIRLSGFDHYSIATSFESYLRITSFLYEEEAIDQDPFLQNNRSSIHLDGKVLSLGENQVLSETQLMVWHLDDEGQRLNQVTEITTDIDGHFSIDDLSEGQTYELQPILDDPTAPKVRYFTPTLNRSHPLFYLRTFPGEGSIASLLVRQIPVDEEEVVLVIFNAHRAFLSGVDTLKINGEELLSEEVASADDTSIALFVFDVNQDDEPGGTLPLFESFPFLSVIDFPLTPSPTESMSLEYNGQTLILPRSPSSDGTLIVVFP
jgi:hypothetical protein